MDSSGFRGLGSTQLDVPYSDLHRVVGSPCHWIFTSQSIYNLLLSSRPAVRLLPDPRSLLYLDCRSVILQGPVTGLGTHARQERESRGAPRRYAAPRGSTNLGSIQRRDIAWIAAREPRNNSTTWKLQLLLPDALEYINGHGVAVDSATPTRGLPAQDCPAL